MGKEPKNNQGVEKTQLTAQQSRPVRSLSMPKRADEQLRSPLNRPWVSKSLWWRAKFQKPALQA